MERGEEESTKELEEREFEDLKTEEIEVFELEPVISNGRSFSEDPIVLMSHEYSTTTISTEKCTELLRLSRNPLTGVNVNYWELSGTNEVLNSAWNTEHIWFCSEWQTNSEYSNFGFSQADILTMSVLLLFYITFLSFMLLWSLWGQKINRSSTNRFTENSREGKREYWD